MTREELFCAIGEAEDGWVQAAEAPVRAAKQRRWPVAAATAAVVVFLVACGVQQGWFRFLTPKEWQDSAPAQRTGIRFSGSMELAGETMDNEMWLGDKKIVFQSQILTQEAFVQQAAANGWPLAWDAAAGLGEFSATQTPCWEAAQLKTEAFPTGQTVLSGTPLETPYALVGTWSSSADRFISISFNLEDGKEEKKFLISESAVFTPLEAKQWNDAVFVEDGLSFGKGAYVVMAWKPLDKAVENAVGPQDALENPPAVHTFDRCLLAISFNGMEKEEALALAQELLKSA